MAVNSNHKEDWDKEAFLQGLKEVPPCSRIMQSRLIKVNAEEMYMIIAFPVVDYYSNPAGSMQAGFYSAAFDNVYGPLCLMASGTPNSVAINLNTEYHRPAFPGDEIAITARVIRKGRSRVFMSAEAYNQQEKLVATSTCNYLLLDSIK
ncbi:MAG TPA: PaaI family thioesterase [Syntrophomonadaceae bacterium]|nr:PaaI family thioesterase [Syntrophomonadaceae bacterium]HNX29877.1 PaaI family thioesterase [Syntrophomonadaceae bacterium]HPR93944.1 PaaI family thioesterase [Syntrophomonadaceae bacterium]